MSKELIEQEITQIIIPTITDITSMRLAVAKLSQLNHYLDRITEEKEKVTKPLNEALKAERARWKPLEDQLNNSISQIRTQMVSYQTAETKRQEEASAKIANRIGEGKGKLKLETAINKINTLNKPEESIETDAGTVKFRSVQKLHITNEALIPREYLITNDKLILEDLKKGQTISGAELVIEQIPVNYR